MRHGGNCSEWGTFALVYPFHEMEFLDVLYRERKNKMPANFVNYIEADFIAWVTLFEAPSSVVRPC